MEDQSLTKVAMRLLLAVLLGFGGLAGLSPAAAEAADEGPKE